MLKRNVSLMLAISVVVGATLSSTTKVQAKEISNEKQAIEKSNTVIDTNQKSNNINDYKPIGINNYVGSLIDSNNKQDLMYLGIFDSDNYLNIAFQVKFTVFNELEKNYRVEFYKNENSSLIKADSVNFSNQKISSINHKLSTNLKKSTYMKQKYIYIKFGISKTAGGEFSDYKTFKVANPYYIANNSKPEIVAEDIELKIGDKFNSKDFAKATDKEDGDLTSKVQVVENNVDTSKEGIYKISYKVTDSYGDSVIKTINVKVKQGLVVTNSAPKIVGKDLELKVGDNFDPLEGVTAKDEEDGNLSSNIEVVKNTVNTSKEGIYETIYKVVDKQGVSTTKTIKVIVKQGLIVNNSAPEIIDKDLELKVGDNFDLLGDVTENYKEDEILNSKIEAIENTIKANEEESYKAIYKLTDKSDSSIKLVNKENIIKNTAPRIIAKDLQIKLGEKFDPLKEIKATDKEDGDLTSKIKVAKNTVDTSKEGTYVVGYEVQDKKGLKATKEIKVKITKETVIKANLPKTGMIGIGLAPIGIATTLAGVFIVRKKK